MMASGPAVSPLPPVALRRRVRRGLPEEFGLPLPQWYADSTGWDGMTATVARVYASLPPADRARATVLAGNYGEAGAIDILGRTYGLPRAIGGHNNYYLWGPGNASGEVAIALGVEESRLRRLFASVERAAVFRCEYCMGYEDDLPVYLARQPFRPLPAAWPLLKHYG